MPKKTQFGPKLAFLTIAGLFGALLVGWLVVVARRLYLARHISTLYICCFSSGMNFAPEGGANKCGWEKGGAMFCRSGGAVGLVTLCRGDGEGSD